MCLLLGNSYIVINDGTFDHTYKDHTQLTTLNISHEMALSILGWVANHRTHACKSPLPLVISVNGFSDYHLKLKYILFSI